MFDDVGMQTFWNEIQRLWVNPEIERRHSEGTISVPFGIRHCLIRLPHGKPPVVEFNHEVQFTTTVKQPIAMTREAGDPVFLWQVERITAVERPTVDGTPVPFVYIHWNGRAWQVIYEFGPAAASEDESWWLSDALSDALNLHLRERAIIHHSFVKEQVLTIGLWPAPALLPYPLTAIAENCKNGKFDEARLLLASHCTVDFLGSLIDSWRNVPSFASRTELFSQTLEAHRDGKFMLSIPALVPQIEGVVTDWLYTNDLGEGVKYWQDKKTVQFKTKMLGNAALPRSEVPLVEEVISFILDGPVLDNFTKWILPAGAFPNRHAVVHGKFDESVFTQENSIKVFLLLDSLHHFMESVPSQDSE